MRNPTPEDADLVAAYKEAVCRAAGEIRDERPPRMVSPKAAAKTKARKKQAKASRKANR